MRFSNRLCLLLLSMFMLGSIEVSASEICKGEQNCSKYSNEIGTKIDKVVEENGTFYAKNIWGDMYTKGGNDYGQLGTNKSYNNKTSQFEMILMPYSISDFTVTDATVKATIKGRNSEFLIWGKNSPEVNTDSPNYKSIFKASQKYNRPMYAKQSGSKIIEIREYLTYSKNSVLSKKAVLKENYTNADKQIGHVNTLVIFKYDPKYNIASDKAEIHFDFNADYRKVVSNSKYDKSGFRTSLSSTFYDQNGKKIKFFEPKFIPGTDIESSEYITSYDYKNNIRTTFYKEFDKNGCIDPNNPNNPNDCRLVKTLKEELSGVNDSSTKNYITSVDATYHQNGSNKMKEETIQWYNTSGVRNKMGINKYSSDGKKIEYNALTYNKDGIIERRWLERYDVDGMKTSTYQTIYVSGVKNRYDETILNKAGKTLKVTKTYYTNKIATRKTINLYNEVTGKDKFAEEYVFRTNGKKESLAQSEFDKNGIRNKYLKLSYEDSPKEYVLSRYQENFHSGSSTNKSVTEKTDYKSGVKKSRAKETFNTSGKKLTRYEVKYKSDGTIESTNFLKF